MKHQNLYLSLFVSLFLLFFSSSPVSAQLVTVKTNGNIDLNILGIQDSLALTIPKSDSLSIKNSAVEGSTNEIKLFKDGETLKISVNTPDGTRSLDITDYKDEVIEIEERGQSQKIEILVKEDKFVLIQSGITAQTSFPINIDPDSAEISVKTETGQKIISILPKGAYETALRAKIMTKLSGDLSINEDNQVLVYSIPGERMVNLFNIADYSVPVNATISASNGEIVAIDQPVWLKLLNFLFE